ncbi:MAG TPA: AAA family ATPase [Streptosporangiaceae bacterium]|nr:AAA family ATPase [Streptosporangiaceae bacterium]
MALAGTLIGRGRELAILGELMRAAAGGRGRAVLIEGEPGIGKSALVHAALAGADDAGCQVFWGAGDELGQALPLLPLLDGLQVREHPEDPRRATIVRLLRGELAADRGTDVSAELAEQLLALVSEQCAALPTVLVVDDLHWADRASVALWGRLARAAGHLPLLLIGTIRPVPHRDDLLAVRRTSGDLVRLRLTGLAEPAVAELVAALAGGRPDDKLLRLADGAAGNPLYVTELVAALTRNSSLTVTDTGTAELLSGPAPRSLSAAIADRLDFVSGPVREVLQAAALLGVDFAVPDLATVLGRGVADLVPAVDVARAAGVLAESGSALSFRHPLIRAALYDAMLAPVRAAWHRDAGRALAQAGAPVDRVARQLLWAAGGPGGSEPMDEWILSWLTRASDLLVVQAPRVAAELLRHAVACSPADSAGHDYLSGRLADALYRIGEIAEAEQVANRALTHAAEPDLIIDLHWTLAQCSIQAGRSAESLALLNRALAAPGIATRHRARLLVLAARTHSNSGEVEKAGRVATSALAAATEASDAWAMGWALHVLSIVTAVQGRSADALALFDRALTVTQSDPALTDLQLLLQINKAITLGNLDQYEEALAAAREARHLAGQVGTTIRLGQAHGALGLLLFETGRWDEAMGEVSAVLHEDRKEPAIACGDLGIAAVICFHRGEVALARDHLAATAAHARRLGNRVIAPLTLARSLDSEHDGALPEALAVLTAGFSANMEELEEVEDLLADAVRLACRIGDLDTARDLAGHAAALAADSQIPHRQANALYCRGLLDHDAERLAEAAERYGEASRPLLHAQALEAAAEHFVGADDRDRARAAFTRALEIYASLGAAADMARLQARFRAHGIRRGPTTKHRRARSGWDSLTPAETKIAALVEGGLSNPEIAAKLFLSRRTVASHVSHILKKLDVNSRTDIAREAALRNIESR